MHQLCGAVFVLRLYYDYIIIFSLKARCFAQAYINRPALSVCTKNGESVVVECRGALGLTIGGLG